MEKAAQHIRDQMLLLSVGKRDSQKKVADMYDVNRKSLKLRINKEVFIFIELNLINILNILFSKLDQIKSVYAVKPRLFSLEDEQAVDYFEWWAKHWKPIAKNGKKGYATNAFEWEKFCLD
jgi:hypothetical protein